MPAWTFALSFLFGLLLVAVSLPMAQGSVQPNRFYGFRTPRLVADPRAWGPANRIAGRDNVIAGVVTMLLSAVVGAWAGSGGAVPVLAGLLVHVGPVLVALLHSFVAASAIVYDLDHPVDGLPEGQDAREKGAPRRREPPGREPV